MEVLNSTTFYRLENVADSYTTHANCSEKNFANCSWNETLEVSDLGVPEEISSEKVYWALVMIPLPLVAVVGNILVILSVYKEKSLQTATNYFIVSLAFADLLVAAVVMPFAVYVLVNVYWELSETLCDFYIALDVTCSTASIFNLVAISIDRFIAVTQPIKYSKHQNNKRVFLTIAIVWVVSAAIGSPIVLGLNTSPERIPHLCVFYNSDFIIYSSLSSFYIPCIVMVYLYYKIFRAIRERAKKALGKKEPLKNVDKRKGLTIENISHTEKDESSMIQSSEYTVISLTLPPIKEYDENAKRDNKHQNQIIIEEGTDDEEEDEEDENGVSETKLKGKCHLIENISTKGIAIISSAKNGKQMQPTEISPGSYSEHIEIEAQFCVCNHLTRSPNRITTSAQSCSSCATYKVNGTETFITNVSQNKTATACLERTSAKSKKFLKPPKQEKKKPRFSLVKNHKLTKREKNAAKRERKATKTLAIVLGVFLMCWVPFFTCNILDAICIKLQNDKWRPGVTAFLLTTWLGYVNSCVNPVIYTIFNMEFRKAFKKLLLEPCK